MSHGQLAEIMREIDLTAGTLSRMALDLASLAAEGDRLAAECARLRAGLRQTSGQMAELTPDDDNDDLIQS